MFFAALKKIIEDNDTPTGRVFDLFIQGLIIASLVSFSIETLPDLAPSTRRALEIFEIVSVMIFTVEYLLRVTVADSKLKFIFSFYGLVDLVAILPFYIASGIDLRSVRVFRLFRLLRAFKVFRYSRAISRFKRALAMMKEELVLFFIATSFLLFVSAVGIYYFEGPAQPEAFQSVFHSLWWAVATLTTVGYGDIYPVTAGGKVFTFIMLMLGLGIVAVPAGLLATSMNKVIEAEKKMQLIGGSKQGEGGG